MSSLITPATWAALGYRRLDLPATSAITAVDVSKLLTERLDYETSPDQIWVRRIGRKKGTSRVDPISVVDVFDAGASLDDERLAFVDDYRRTIYAKRPRSIKVEGDQLKDLLVAAFGQELRCRGFGDIGKALAFADLDQIRPLLREHIAPWFFREYPGGRIAVIRYHDECEKLTGVIRGLYTATQADAGEWKTLTSFRSMREWQAGSLLTMGRTLLDVFGYLFYPHVTAYQASGQLGLTFVFLLDPPASFEPGPFPSDWYAIPRSHAGFGEEAIDHSSAVIAPRGADAAQSVHRRYRHTRTFTGAELEEFLRWYVTVLNNFFYELGDVANFTEDRADPDSAIDPVFAFEHFLTVDRVVRKTLGSMSLNEVSAAKSAVFEIADLHDTLSHLFAGTGSTVFFKSLFNPNSAPALLKPILSKAPEPFGSYFADFIDELYEELRKTIIDSVILPGRVLPGGGVNVPNSAGTGINTESEPDFVANVVRALRNAHHGYFTAGDKSRRPSRYLFMVDGNIPDSITALPALWLLAYLAQPDIVGWKVLPTAAFD